MSYRGPMSPAIRSLAVCPGSTPPGTEEADEICPLCGRPLWNNRRALAPHLPPLPWWPWLFVTVGIYVIVVFGWKAWQVSPDLPSPSLARSRDLACLAGHANASACRIAYQATATLARDRAAIVVAGGAVLLGVGRLARQRPRRFTRPMSGSAVATRQADALDPFVATARGLWILGEKLLVSGIQTLLRIVSVGVVAAPVRGEPPSWHVVNTVLDRTINAVMVIGGQLVP